MVAIAPLTAVLAGLSLVAVASTIPYTMTAIDYRDRDNGLSYLIFVAGVGIWNAMVVVQLLTPEPTVKLFFVALSTVGAVVAGLGWFLFATTASSTDDRFDRQWIYGVVSVLGGVDIALAVIAPVHDIYWVGATGGLYEFAVVTPAPGYWFHTVVLAGLFAAGGWQFARAWQRGVNVGYTRAYVVGAAVTAVAVLLSNGAIPGGPNAGPIAAASLTTVGWVQASRGRALARLRALV